MPSFRNRIVLIVLGGLVVLWLLWTILGSLWLNPVAELEARIATLKSQVNGYTVSDERLSEVEGSINDFIGRTLGGSLEEVDHQLRSRLNRLGESVGLKDLSVGTGRSVAMMSPGKNDFKGASRRELREEIDFVEVEGRLSGITDWPGVLELLDRLDTASWLNKIESIRLREAGSRMQITIQLRTLFIPGQSPAVEPVDQWTKDRMTAMAELASRNPFMLPTTTTTFAQTETQTDAKNSDSTRTSGLAGHRHYRHRGNCRGVDSQCPFRADSAIIDG